jgi:hypothetical protein
MALSAVPKTKTIPGTTVPRFPTLSDVTAGNILKKYRPVAAGSEAQATTPIDTSLAAGQATNYGDTSTLQGYRPLSRDELYQAILNDPTVSLANQMMVANQQMAKRSAQDIINSVMVKSGYGNLFTNSPQMLWDFAPDAATQAAAAGNQLSDRAQVQRALDTGMANLPYALAARGMGASGASAIGASSLLQQSQQANYDRMNTALDAIRQAVMGYQGTVSSEQDKLLAARAAAAAWLAQTQIPIYGGGGGGGTTTGGTTRPPVLPTGGPNDPWGSFTVPGTGLIGM